MFTITTNALTHKLLLFYNHLQRKERETIGRVTPQMLEKYASTRRLHTLLNDKDPLGYIIANDTSRHPARTIYPGDMRIYIACIDYDARRHLHGTMLVDHIAELARLSQLQRIGLWCAEGIPAHDFWTSIGFTPGRTREGGQKRNRTHVEYTRAVDFPH